MCVVSSSFMLSLLRGFGLVFISNKLHSEYVLSISFILEISEELSLLIIYCRSTFSLVFSGKNTLYAV